MQTSEFVYNFRMITGFMMAAVGLGAALSTTVAMLFHLKEKRKENYPIAYGSMFAVLAPIGLITIPYPAVSKYWPAGIFFHPFFIFILIMLVEKNEKKKK